MEAWEVQVEKPTARAADKSVREALTVPAGSECPGRLGLCGLPLTAGEELCPGCADTLEPFDGRGSAALRRQIQPPTAPECATCRRPVPHWGETCRWCRGQGPSGASRVLQARIETRAAAECPGDGGMCRAPLQPGETHCGRCQQNPMQATSPAWERCRGQDGRCGRLVLPGRGQCLECRQAAGVSRIATFGRDGAM